MGRLLIYSSLLLISDQALAGAWLQKPGESELITQYENKILTTYYKDPYSNENTNSRIFSFDIYSVFYQYGFNSQYNLGFKTLWYNYKGFDGDSYSDNNYNDSLLLKNSPSNEYVFFSENELMLDDYYKQSENKPSEANFFIQKELLYDDHSVLSIKPSILFYNADFDKALELRFLYGHNFKLIKEEYSYINIETAINRCTNKFFVEDIDYITFIVDLTLGIALNEKNTIMFQSFYKNNPSLNVIEDVGQISLVYKYNENVSWQTGYSTNIRDRDSYISNSVITGLWFKF